MSESFEPQRDVPAVAERATRQTLDAVTGMLVGFGLENFSIDLADIRLGRTAEKKRQVLQMLYRGCIFRLFARFGIVMNTQREAELLDVRNESTPLHYNEYILQKVEVAVRGGLDHSDSTPNVEGNLDAREQANRCVELLLRFSGIAEDEDYMQQGGDNYVWDEDVEDRDAIMVAWESYFHVYCAEVDPRAAQSVGQYKEQIAAFFTGNLVPAPEEFIG